MRPRLGVPAAVWRASGALVALPLLLSACGHDATAPHAAPATAGDCNDLGSHRDDGFVLAGTDWSTENRAYAESAVVYACVDPGMGGTVRLQPSGPGITVRPRSRRTASAEVGVLAFRVRTRPGATGALTMSQESDGGTTGAQGPTVVTDADGWHFASTD
jgi:hypothetical protein